MGVKVNLGLGQLIGMTGVIRTGTENEDIIEGQDQDHLLIENTRSIIIDQDLDLKEMPEAEMIGKEEDHQDQEVKIMKI